jgi:sugar lactone lactonase YvrE
MTRMKTAMARKFFAATLLAISACAHAPPAPPTPVIAARVWPDAPASPLIRYVGAFPGADRPGPKPSVWTQIWETILGINERPKSGPVFARPFGVAASGDRFLVADPDAKQVLEIDWRKNELRKLECPDRPWAMPMALAVAQDGTVWVADGSGGVLVHVGEKKCDLVGAGHLERPTGVVLAEGHVYAVDPPKHAVVAFSLEGQELLRFGARGDESGQFNYPTALTLGAPGELLVVDALNFRIARFSTDGRFLGSFGEAGDGNGAFGRPKAVAMDPSGRLYVSDAQNDVVIGYDVGGRYRLAFGGTGDAPGGLTMPAGLAVAGERLFVADSQNHRVQIYELLAGGK